MLICGCAELLFEGIEAGDAAGGALESEIAPGMGLSALGSINDLFWPEGTTQTFDVPLDEDVITPAVGRTRLSIDLASGEVRTENGLEVARIEGNKVYRVYPQGSHQLIAEIETRLAEPVNAYSDPTVLDRVRVLKTGDLVQVVRVDKGWYQLRYVDNGVSDVLLWVFAPALISRVTQELSNNQYPQSISFTTRIPKSELIKSTLQSTNQVHADIENILSSH